MPTSSIFAMDTGFFTSLGTYRFEARCEMLRELGYDATYLTLWDEAAWADLPMLATVRERHGIGVAAVYATLNIDAPADDPENRLLPGLIDRLDETRTIELTLRSNDPAHPPSSTTGDDAARRWLERLVPMARARGITLALYPHIRHWLERVDDAVRLCAAIDDPALRLTFPSFHWYAVDGTDLDGTLRRSAPYLALVNISGSRRLAPGTLAGNGIPATIEPADEGDLDLFALLGALRRVGYGGPIGIQGYSVGGDAYAKLRRSLAAVRDVERRLDAHPDWAVLRSPPFS